MTRIYFVRAPSDELYHFGVKGMRWGFRKDDYNNKYSLSDRKIDKAMYGRRGVKRINKRLNSGVGLNDARAIESRRLIRARKKAKAAAAIGAGIGGFAGYMVGSHYADKVNRKILSSSGLGDWIASGRPGANATKLDTAAYVGKRVGKQMAYDYTVGNIPYRVIGGVGGYAGARLGGRIARNAYMLYSGYGRKQFR